jgi:hypothetical protein
MLETSHEALTIGLLGHPRPGCRQYAINHEVRMRSPCQLDMEFLAGVF